MARRVCLDCPAIITKGSRCTSCSRKRDRDRGTRQQRGYDAAYDAERRRLQDLMDQGREFWCWRCPELGRPRHLVDPKHWHLGHDNDDRSVIRGPQCPASNLATASPAPG